MRNLKNLNIEKSIELQKLVYIESGFNKFQKICFYFVCIWGFIIPFLIYFDPYRNKSKTGTEYYVLFIVSLFCVYAFYKNVTEKRLIKITGKYNAQKHQLIINEYCEKRGFEKHRSSKNIIIYNREHPFNFNTNYETSRIFFLNGQNIYLTILREDKLNRPVLFSQISLMRDIKKLCQ